MVFVLLVCILIERVLDMKVYIRNKLDKWSRYSDANNRKTPDVFSRWIIQLTQQLVFLITTIVIFMFCDITPADTSLLTKSLLSLLFIWVFPYVPLFIFTYPHVFDSGYFITTCHYFIADSSDIICNYFNSVDSSDIVYTPRCILKDCGSKFLLKTVT